MPERIVIVGGVAAGMSAAAEARRQAPEALITVLEAGPAASYGACGIPHALSRQTRLEHLVVHPAEYFRERRRIDLRLRHRVLEIQPARRRLRVQPGSGDVLDVPYDKLILATGATARALAVSGELAGAELPGVFCANTYAQAASLLQHLEGRTAGRWAVLGAGYIGLEMAEALHRRGASVTVFERYHQPLPGWDEAITARLAAELEATGIRLRLGESALGLEAGATGTLAVRSALGAHAFDGVLLATGLVPNVELARAAGLTLGSTGALAVDAEQRTGSGGILAAGDCAETRHLITGAPIWMPLGGPANKQGRIAGHNAAAISRSRRFAGVLGTLALRLLTHDVGRCGLTAAQAQQAGFSVSEHRAELRLTPGYQPPQHLAVLLVAERGSGRLLGCQMLGDAGTVAARLDVAATVIAARLRLCDLEEMDWAYAPGLAPLEEPLARAARRG